LYCARICLEPVWNWSMEHLLRAYSDLLNIIHVYREHMYLGSLWRLTTTLYKKGDWFRFAFANFPFYVVTCCHFHVLILNLSPSWYTRIWCVYDNFLKLDLLPSKSWCCSVIKDLVYIIILHCSSLDNFWMLNIRSLDTIFWWMYCHKSTNVNFVY
jgi:hypothetical protein